MTLVNLNNQDMELRYDYNSVCDIEDKTGKGIQSLIHEDAGFFSLCRVLLWAGLRHKIGTLQISIVGNWLYDEIKKGKEVSEYMEKCMKELVASGVLGEPLKDGEDMGEIIPVNQ